MKKYYSKNIDISWDKDVCNHAEVCIKTLPSVFNIHKKPWVNPDGSSVPDIKAMIGNCPSGALIWYEQGKSSDETVTDQENNASIAIVSNGPLRVKGNFDLLDFDGNAIEHKSIISLCRCGASKNKPYCDGAHKEIGFKG